MIWFRVLFGECKVMRCGSVILATRSPIKKRCSAASIHNPSREATKALVVHRDNSSLSHPALSKGSDK